MHCSHILTGFVIWLDDTAPADGAGCVCAKFVSFAGSGFFAIGNEVGGTTLDVDFDSLELDWGGRRGDNGGSFCESNNCAIVATALRLRGETASLLGGEDEEVVEAVEATKKKKG